jgi:hypothetical protein
MRRSHQWARMDFSDSLHEDGNGGSYAESPTIKIQVNDGYPYRVLSLGPDNRCRYPGILGMLHSFSFSVPLRTDVRWNTALIILMRMTGFLPSNEPLVKLARLS